MINFTDQSVFLLIKKFSGVAEFRYTTRVYPKMYPLGKCDFLAFLYLIKSKKLKVLSSEQKDFVRQYVTIWCVNMFKFFTTCPTTSLSIFEGGRS
ncbi:MAG: hypothetical protein RLZZ499_624 [Cyanobacteriota bacterium]